MADENNDDATKPPNFRVSIEQSLAGLVDADVFVKSTEWIRALLLQVFSKIVEWTLRAGAKIGGTLALAIAQGEDKSQDAFGELASVAIQDMFGVQSNPRSLNDRGNRGGRQQVAADIGDMLLKAFSGQAGAETTGEIEPSDAPAKTFISAMAQMALEGWLEGWIVEACTLGQLETFGDLDDTLSHVLGLGRASASVHGPIVKHMIVEPLDQKINLAHRPNLLGAGEVARQVARGRWTLDKGRRELGRQGWSDDRIDALFNATAKFLSLGDQMSLVRVGALSRNAVVQSLMDQGFDKIIAEQQVEAHQQQRLEAIDQAPVPSIIRAFANGDISPVDMQSMLAAIVNDPSELAFRVSQANVEKTLNVQHLSSSDALAAAKLGILAVSDYRRVLEREGWDDEAVLVKELLLREQIDKDTTIADQRKKAEADRAAEKQARADAAAKRLADLEAQRALARRGSLAELQRAAVRGLIPFARLEEVLAAQYDGDTVSIILSGVELDRENYLAQQQAAADAKKRAEERQIDVGSLERAVLAGLLTLSEFRSRLDFFKFTPADADLLTATLAARKADLDDAQQKRRDADAAAKNKSIDLSRFEQLVRRGVRTFADYDALLSSLGFGDAARAAMADLLNLHIADDEAARKLRDELAAQSKIKGLTLEQLRRAVILGVAPIESFDVFLTTQNFTPEAHTVLMAELRDDVTQADAARRKREAAAAQTDPRVLPFATLERAARLGIISPATYQARLAALGFTADDIAIELDLLVMEIADVQAARQKQDQQQQQATDRGLTLAQLANAVKLGEASVDDYRVRAIELGYAADDVAVLVNVLLDELAAHAAAQQQRPTVLSAAAAGGVSLDALEGQVKDGSLTGAAFVAALVRAGVAPDQAELAAAPLMVTS